MTSNGQPASFKLPTKCEALTCTRHHENKYTAQQATGPSQLHSCLAVFAELQLYRTQHPSPSASGAGAPY